jgi:hypothetical protein
MVPGGTRPYPFVIPSAVEASLAIQEIFRDVSVRAGLAFSLAMTNRSCEMTVIGGEIVDWSS